MHKVISVFLVIFWASYVTASELKSIDSIPENISSIKAVIPIYSQKLAFQLPTTWKPAYQDNKPTFYLIEFTPQNESIQSWNNLLSIQGFKDLSQRTSAENFLDNLASRFKSTCGENLVYEKLGSSQVDGYKSYTAILGCSEVPMSDRTGIKNGQSEIGYYLSIQGKKDIYLIHKSIRGDAFKTSEPPLNKDNVSTFIEAITPIELCKKGGNQGECLK